MPISLNWENEEKTILRHIYEGKVTPDEFHAAVDENFQLQQSVDHPVAVISDLTQLQSMANLLLSGVLSHVGQQNPPNQEMVVIVGADRWMKQTVNIAKNVVKSPNIHMVDTLEDALALINKQRV